MLRFWSIREQLAGRRFDQFVQRPDALLAVDLRGDLRVGIQADVGPVDIKCAAVVKAHLFGCQVQGNRVVIDNCEEFAGIIRLINL